MSAGLRSFVFVCAVSEPDTRLHGARPVKSHGLQPTTSGEFCESYEKTPHNKHQKRCTPSHVNQPTASMCACVCARTKQQRVLALLCTTALPLCARRRTNAVFENHTKTLRSGSCVVEWIHTTCLSHGQAHTAKRMRHTPSCATPTPSATRNGSLLLGVAVAAVHAVHALLHVVSRHMENHVCVAATTSIHGALLLRLLKRAFVMVPHST